MRFTALKTFEHREGERLVAIYTAGLSYTVRPGNDKLAAQVKKWIAEGKAMEGGQPTIAQVKGRG